MTTLIRSLAETLEQMERDERLRFLRRVDRAAKLAAGETGVMTWGHFRRAMRDPPLTGATP